MDAIRFTRRSSMAPGSWRLGLLAVAVLAAMALTFAWTATAGAATYKPTKADRAIAKRLKRQMDADLRANPALRYAPFPRELDLYRGGGGGARISQVPAFSPCAANGWAIPQRQFTPPGDRKAIKMTWNFSVGCFAPVIIVLSTNMVSPDGASHAGSNAGNPAAIGSNADGPQGTWALFWNFVMYAPPGWTWGPAPGCGSFANVARCAGGQAFPILFPS